MGALASLSNSATLMGLHVADLAVLGFGFFFLTGWIAEEFTKSEGWKKYHRLFVVIAIVGVTGEWIADLAVFELSEHLQTIAASEIAALNLRAIQLAKDTETLRLQLANADERVANAARDAAKAAERASEAESHLSEANARAAEASAKAEQFRLGIADAEKDAAEAKARLAETNLELAKMRVPRTLTSEQQAHLLSVLKPFAGQKFSLSVQGEAEAIDLLKTLKAILVSAGWVQIPTQLGAVEIGDAGQIFVTGVVVEITPKAEMKRAEIAALLANELNASGIATRAWRNVQLRDDAAINVAVGKKP